MGPVAVLVDVARWVPVAVPVDGRLLGLGRRATRRHLRGHVGFCGFGGRCRKSDRRGNAQRRWRAGEGQGVVDSELQIDNFETPEEAREFFESDAFAENPVGVLFDPDELAARFEAGEPVAELVKRP